MSNPAADTASTPTPAPDFGAIDSLADYAAARETVLHSPASEATPAEPAATAADVADAPAQGDPTETTDAAETQPAADEQGRDEQGRFKPKKSAQRRIDEAIYQREEARRELAAAREQLAAYQRQQAAPQGRVEQGQYTPGLAADPQPDPSDAARYPDGVWDQRFQADMARWGARQEVRAYEQQQLQARAQQAVETEQQAIAREFVSRMDAAAQADPQLAEPLAPHVQDLRPLMSLHPGEQPTGETAMADALLTSEQPARLAQYLSTHPDDFRRIAALHPTLAMREIGRLEARLDTAPRAGSVPQAPSISQAKPPIQPVGRSVSAASSTREPGQISSVAEWEAVRPRYASRT